MAKGKVVQNLTAPSVLGPFPQVVHLETEMVPQESENQWSHSQKYFRTFVFRLSHFLEKIESHGSHETPIF